MAISITNQDIINIAPELEGKEDLIDIYIDIAIDSISESIWGTTKGTNAAKLLVAHMTTMSTREGTEGGLVRRKKIGTAEIEYIDRHVGSDNQNDEYFNLTSYGRNYLFLRKQLVITPLVAGCND